MNLEPIGISGAVFFPRCGERAPSKTAKRQSIRAHVKRLASARAQKAAEDRRKECLAGIPRFRKAETTERIAAVLMSRGRTWAEACGRSVCADIFKARQEVMFVLRQCGFSLPRIGRWLGGRHHTTVLKGIRRHQARIDAGEAIAPGAAVGVAR